MKKLTLAVIALSSLLTAAQTVKTGNAPFPTCNPCDWAHAKAQTVKPQNAPFPTCNPCDWAR